MRYDYGLGHDADYIEYFTVNVDFHTPSACVWMIPGTWLED